MHAIKTKITAVTLCVIVIAMAAAAGLGSAAIIGEVYDHSPGFRIGGGEFAALIMNHDYERREELLSLFDEKCAQKRLEEAEVWEQVDVARGMAAYDPQEDETANDAVRRADKSMYENKWTTKHRATA